MAEKSEVFIKMPTDNFNLLIIKAYGYEHHLSMRYWQAILMWFLLRSINKALNCWGNVESKRIGGQK